MDEGREDGASVPRLVEDPHTHSYILWSLQYQRWQNYLQSKKDGLCVNKPLPVINSLTLPQSNEVETGEKTNFTHQYKGFTLVFIFICLLTL